MTETKWCLKWLKFKIQKRNFYSHLPIRTLNCFLISVVEIPQEYLPARASIYVSAGWFSQGNIARKGNAVPNGWHVWRDVGLSCPKSSLDPECGPAHPQPCAGGGLLLWKVTTLVLRDVWAVHRSLCPRTQAPPRAPSVPTCFSLFLAPAPPWDFALPLSLPSFLPPERTVCKFWI